MSHDCKVIRNVFHRNAVIDAVNGRDDVSGRDCDYVQYPMCDDYEHDSEFGLDADEHDDHEPDV